MLTVPPKPRVTDSVDCGDYLRQRIEISTEPGVRMPLFALIPKRGAPPYPAVIAPHGHASGGKLSVAGVGDIPEIANAIKTFNYDYGVQFVRAGFIVFCPDARGFGERQEAAAKCNLLNSSCPLLNNMAYPLGQTVTGMWTWDLHRLVDYIQSRPDCIAGRIGCAGLSGGGLQTLWAAALDRRIRCAVISGYLYGYKQSLLDMHQNCSCNYVPHLYEYVDMGDIAALIAPRPLLIETGTKDPLNGAGGMQNVLAQVATIRKAYRLLQAAPLLRHDIFEGEHRWHGTEAIPWMQRHLGGGKV
jgi:dienelactone hydrolase